MNQNTLTGHLRILANSSVIIARGNITKPRYHLNLTAFRILNEQWLRKFVESEAPNDETTSHREGVSTKKHYRTYIRAAPEIVWIQMTDDRRAKLWLQMDLSTETNEKFVNFKIGSAIAFVGKIVQFEINKVISYEIETSKIRNGNELSDFATVSWSLRPIGDYATKLDLSIEYPEIDNEMIRLFFNRWPEAISKLKTLSETGTRFWISPLDASN